MKTLFSVLKSKTAKTAAVVSGLIATGVAQAQIDVSAAEASVSGAATPVTTIGVAVIGVLAVVATFKYIRRVF